MKCPNCGSALDLNMTSDKHIAFCPYCGHKIPFGDYKYEKKDINITYTDKAKLEKEKNMTPGVQIVAAIAGTILAIAVLLFIYLSSQSM